MLTQGFSLLAVVLYWKVFLFTVVSPPHVLVVSLCSTAALDSEWRNTHSKHRSPINLVVATNSF